MSHLRRKAAGDGVICCYLALSASSGIYKARTFFGGLSISSALGLTFLFQSQGLLTIDVKTHLVTWVVR